MVEWQSGERVPIVALDRRFYAWDDKEPPDPEIRRAFGLEEGGAGWDELLLKRRVVILAEAGSGKSTEMAERARLTDASHRYAFHATIEDVGRDGLEGALSASGREKLNAWYRYNAWGDSCSAASCRYNWKSYSW